MFLRLAVLILALAGLGPLSPSPAHSERSGQVPYVESVSVLEDPSNALAAGDVLAGKYDDSFKQTSPPFHSNKHGRAYWFRITVRFPPEAMSSSWVLDLSWNTLRVLDYYYLENGQVKTFTHGENNLYIDSSINLPPATGDDCVLLVRLSVLAGLNIFPVVRDFAAVEREGELRKWSLGMLFGLMGGMLVYNIFLFISLKDESYLWYVMHLALLMAYYMSMNGIADSLLEFDSKSLDDFIYWLAVLMGCVFICIGMFAKSFLLLKEKSSILNAVVLIQISVSTVYVVTLLLLGLQRVVVFGSYMGMLTSITIFGVGLVRLMQGFKPARFFFVGWTAYVAGGFVYSASFAGAIAPTFFTLHSIELGSAVESMIMALALAYRVKILQEERARAESERQRLSQENTLQSLILENSRLGISLEQGGSIIRANRQFRAMAGRNGDAEPIRLDDIPGFVSLFGQRSDGGGPDLLEREGETGAAANRKTLRALGKVVGSASTKAGVVWVAEDVTEQKRLEQLKDDIDRIVRHDLRSPLACIRSLYEAITRAGPLNAKQDNLLKLIGEASGRALGQLDASLAVYEIESGSYAPDFSPVDLMKSITGAVSELTTSMPKGQNMVKTVLGEGAQTRELYIHGNETLLHVLLVNLIKNALEAAGTQGETVIGINISGGFTALDITNPGEVPPEIRDTFFEKFITARKSKGTGLGTYSARLMARALGGDIRLDCSRPGYTTLGVRLVSTGPPPPPSEDEGLCGVSWGKLLEALEAQDGG